MEILLHHDYLIKALSSSEEPSVLELCQAGRCKGWVASTTIQALWQGLKKDERNKIKPLLEHLSVVTPTARDLKDALQGDDFEEKLALTLSRSCGFDAVVSTMPGKFFNIYRGRGNDDFQLRTLAQKIFQIAQQKINI